ncbi:MAG: hypothetical protein ABF260_09520 [Flavobacteriaceae bacterium]
MPFNSETAKAAGKKSKRGPSKVLDPNIKEKIEILYESVLDHLLVHQQELSMSERVKLLQSLSGYILAKTKPVRDKFTIQELIDRESIPLMERGPYPTT